MIRWLILLILVALPAQSEETVVAGLSQNRISISSNFDGSELLIFGAIKRETAIDREPLGVIVTVEGPTTPLTVWRKDKHALIWINDTAVEIDSAPSFYAVNTSGPIRDVLLETSDLRHRITIPRAIRSVGASIAGSAAFTEALIRIRERNQLYQTNIGAVELREQTLFDTTVALPANLVEGVYVSRIFLTRDGSVVASYSTAINVEKVGLEKFLHALAHDQPLVYALMSLAIAIAAGWGASAVFRYIRS